MRFLKGTKSSLKSLLKGKNKAYVIAVAGVSEGIGCTHQAILLANFARRLGAKTAVCECNSGESFSLLERALGYNKMSNNFTFKGIKFFKNVDSYTLDDIMQMGFHVVILDIGHQLRHLRERFINADLPLVISRMNDWKMDEIGVFCEENIDLLSPRVKWVALYSTKMERMSLKTKYAKDFYSLPFIRDPFVKDKKAEEFLEKIFI